MHPVHVLTALGGAARWAELVEHGVARRALAAAVDDGAVVLLRRGVYCLAGAEDRPLVRAVTLSGVLSCASAAVHHGLEVFGAHRVHVTATARGVARAVVLHRRAVDADARVTTLRQTLLDCCRCLPLGQAVSALDSALRQGRVELPELLALVPSSGPWASRVAGAVRLVDPQAASVLESAARVLLVQAEVGEVTSQVQVPRVGWVDLVVAGRLVVETDGRAVHHDTFAEDRRRDAELVRQGYLVVRFTYQDVERRPAWVVQVVREALREHPPRRHDPSHRRARER